MLNGRWLAETRRLQEETYGVDFDELEVGSTALADYLAIQLLALHDEVSEIADHIGWKTWSKSRGWVNRDKAADEVVDALHFVANILVVLGVTDEEINERYLGKMEINRQRQVSGYEQRRDKS